MQLVQTFGRKKTAIAVASVREAKEGSPKKQYFFHNLN